MEKILITGARGYLGSCLMQDLTEAGYTAVALRGRLAELKPQQLANYSVVIHCAGALRHRPEDFITSNVEGTRTLLSALAPQTQLLHISSRAVYSPGSQALTESMSCNPLDAYGQSKLKAEALVQESPVSTTILRMGLLFGQAANRSLGHSFLSHAISTLAQGKRVRVYTPDVMHDSLAVHDLSRWLVQGLQQNAWKPEIYNVAGPPRSLHQTLHDFCKGLERPLESLYFEPGPPPRMPLMETQGLDQILPDRTISSDQAIARLSS